MPASAAPLPVIHVLAGILLDDRGHLLLAQRPPGKHLAGFWEFPGGKCEPCETLLATLTRELQEELGILVLRAQPFIRVPCRQGERELLIDAWRVTSWRGEPLSREGQSLEWLTPAQVDALTLAPADRVILAALR